MNILLVNTLPIPSGHASINRALSLSKGLVEQGATVTILSSGRGKDTEYHHIDGVMYRNLSTEGNRLISLLKSLFSLITYIHHERKSVDVIWVFSSSPLLYISLWILSKLYSINYVNEQSEYPFELMKSGFIAQLWARFYTHTIYKLFDAMIIMTQPLMHYFKGLVRSDCKLIHLPMTVDIGRFENIIADNKYGEYAAYCGNMSGNKDGVENLIEAFQLVEAKYPDFKLVMVGDANTVEEFEVIKERVTKRGLRNVVFTGRIPRDQIPGILSNAKMLCLARPTSLQSAGGFPTKLGEYLMTGNPVVVTTVGDIPRYLDERNSFLVIPDDNIQFGKTMIKVLDNYEHAASVGLKGRELALTHFNYKVQAARLHNFFIELTKTK